ncbi:MAG: hypothetical protein GXO48_01045, partial [Chlorobi bacterium]|nr:hypothetical protein [Chlorobiota bacterium]
DGSQWVLAKDSVGDNWGSQVAVTQSPIVGDGTTTNPIGLQGGTNAGDILIWDGSQWQIKASPFDSVCGTAMANYVQKWTGSELCNSVIYDDGTRVGIGTNSPGARLEVKDSQITDVRVHVFNAHPNPPQGYNNSGLSGNAALELRSASPGGVQYIDFVPDALNNDFLGRISYNEFGKDRMAFYTGGQFRMIIDSAGRVGIGTSVPQTLLHVAERGYFNDAIIEGSLLIKTVTDNLRYSEGLRLGGHTPTQTFYFDFAAQTAVPPGTGQDSLVIWVIKSWVPLGSSLPALPILVHGHGGLWVSQGVRTDPLQIANYYKSTPPTIGAVNLIDSMAGDIKLVLHNLLDSTTNSNRASSGNAAIELRTDNIDAVQYIDFVPAQRTPGYIDFSGRISYNEYHRHMLNIFVNRGRRLIIDSLGRVGIFQNPPAATYVPTNILTIQQGSPTDPIADSWTVYSTRETKSEVLGVVGQEDMSKYLKYFREMPVYRWRRTEGEQVRLSPMADDVGVPGEIRAYDGEGNVQGIDLYGYIGYLHVVIKGILQMVEEQQKIIASQQREINELKQKIK